MSTTRRLAAIPVIGVALGLCAFGVIRGATNAGPAHGVRLIVAIEPPVDDAARTMAAHVAQERLDEKGLEVRVVPAGNTLVAEVGTDDPAVVTNLRELLERTANLEVRPVNSTDVVLDGRAIERAEVLAGGVAIEVRSPDQLARVTPGVPIEFVLDGHIRMTAAPDRVIGRELHVPVSGNDVDATRAALEFVAAIEAGAVRPMHVRSHEMFQRATGFWPRAWPFFAVAAVFSLAALVLLRRR
jgi:hypothetical protein